MERHLNKTTNSMNEFIAILLDVLNEEINGNEIYYRENPNCLDDLKIAAHTVFEAARITPILLDVLEQTRRNGDNALMQETEQIMDEAIAKARSIQVKP